MASPTAPVVIIGGDAAGMSAASKARREDPSLPVIVFEQGPDISYAACGMPYWFEGLVQSDEMLRALHLEDARRKRGIDVRIHHRVTAIHPEAHTVEVQDLERDRTFIQPYSKLLIATGASPVVPPIPGLDLPGVFTLRTLEDGRRIHRYLESRRPRRGVIIGAGYIGLEMAEAFRSRGMETWVLELLPQILPQMDPDLLAPVVDHLVEQGVHLHTSTRVTGVRQANGALQVVALQEDGRSLTVAADMVLVSTGIRPNSRLAAEAGLALTVANAIQVDERMRTSAPDIYAAGDCVAYRHRVLDREVWIPLAPSANKSGRVAGENMAGGHAIFPGILGTAVVKVFDYSLAVTGLTEGQAQEHAERFAGGVAASTITAPSKPAYYPGAQPVHVKVVIERATGRILGAQLVSRSDVSKRADIFATAITAGMTVAEFGLLDLTYAPPFAPVYDPVLVAANVAARHVQPVPG